MALMISGWIPALLSLAKLRKGFMDPVNVADAGEVNIFANAHAFALPARSKAQIRNTFLNEIWTWGEVFFCIESEERTELHWRRNSSEGHVFLPICLVVLGFLVACMAVCWEES